MSDDETHGLTGDELQAAQACGLTPEDYAFWRVRGRSGAEVDAHLKRDDDPGLEDRIKQAVREALAERDAAA